VGNRQEVDKDKMANRVTKVGIAVTERRDSVGESIEEHLKRKREMWGEDGRDEAGIAKIFKRSNRTKRSPRQGKD